jgi:hypothetical protein
MATTDELQGPAGYENWRASLKGDKPTAEFELQLYSDAHVVDEVTTGCGPYSFFNAVPAGAIGTFTHVATARIALWTTPLRPDLSRTDYSRYHGGWLPDELSALCSLAMGIRLKSGGVSREFDEQTPRGRPWADTSAPPSPLPARQNSWMVPRAHELHNIRTVLVPRFATYPTLKVAEAITLVRAARLYQDAIWVAESEPQLAWLLLVSAVEVVATHHQAATSSNEDILSVALPALHAELLASGGPELLAKCAGHLVRHLRATNRFLSFLDEFLPAAPPRPPERLIEIPWERANLRRAFSQVYNYRSLALHDGTPFPWPMCQPPMLGGWHHERPSGLAQGGNEAAWLAADTPMLLHVFEHVARNAILSWWDSRSAQQGVAAAEPPPSYLGC